MCNMYQSLTAHSTKYVLTIRNAIAARLFRIDSAKTNAKTNKFSHSKINWAKPFRHAHDVRCTYICKSLQKTKMFRQKLFDVCRLHLRVHAIRTLICALYWNVRKIENVVFLTCLQNQMHRINKRWVYGEWQW